MSSLLRPAAALAMTTIALLGAAPAQASTILELFSRPGACFARTYTPAHLRSHPRQTVRFVYLRDPGAEWRATQTPGHFNLAFGLRLVGHRDTYSGVAICSPHGDGAACDVEGGGGSFHIAQTGATLRLEVSRLQLEGAHDFTDDIARGDNRVMLLSRAAASVCPRG